MLRNYAAASAAVLKFYLSMIFRFGEIHPDLPSGKLLGHIVNLPKVQTTAATFRLKKKFRTDFNEGYDDLRRTLRTELAGVANISFERTLLLSFAVRAGWVLLCVWGVVMTNTRDSQFAIAPRVLLLFAGLLQFLVAPMSLVVCVMRLGTNIWDCLLHYLCNAAAAGLVALATGGAGIGLSLPLFDARVAAGFLVVDFVVNLAVYWRVSEPFGFWRLLKHIVYGTFNTKTYFLVVFALLNGLRVDAVVLLLTGVLTHLVYSKGVFQRTLELLGLPSFPVMFYCEHRINHCPVVYAHAHKMHHYLHDTTAFDGHIYGSGMNEEFLWIAAEVLPCLTAAAVCGPGAAAAGLGLFPFFLNAQTLHASWTNKGGHSRTSAAGADSWADFDADNFHADHHTLHRANYGSAYGVLIDFYFGTNGKSTRGCFGKTFEIVSDDSSHHDASHGAGSDILVLRVADVPAGRTNRTPFRPR